MKLKNYLGIAIVVGVSCVLGVLIWSMDPKPSPSDHHSHDHTAVKPGAHDHDHDRPRSHGHDGDKSSGNGHDHAAEKPGAHDHDHDHDKPPGGLHAAIKPSAHEHDHDKAGAHDRDHEEASGHDHEKPGTHDHAAEKPGAHDHGHDHGEGDRGPHGGRLLEKGDFEVEVTIFEKGVPPHFRIYSYENHKPIDPKDVNVTVELHRLGGRVTEFKFHPAGDYLKCDKIVEEPHSFDVKVSAEHDGKKYEWEYDQIEGRIHLRPEVARRVGIQALLAGPQRIISILELPGEIVLNADRVSHIVPRITGVVAEARKNLGDPVKEGEVIAVIDSRELANAKSGYLVHRKREELARINYERIKKLWEQRVSPEKDFIDAQKTLEEEKIETLAAAQKLRALGLSKAELEDLRRDPDQLMTRYELRAPFDGVVITKHLTKGEWVGESADIMSVADLSTVWVDITVYATYLDSVRVGQKVTVAADSSDINDSGVVSYVGPLVGEETRTATARVVLENADGRWRPGMFVTVKIVQRDEHVPLAIRKEAVQTMERFGSVVFVQYGDQFEVRPVELGRSDGINVEVLKGLFPGEKYVAAKSFMLKSELSTEGLSHTH